MRREVDILLGWVDGVFETGGGRVRVVGKGIRLVW